MWISGKIVVLKNYFEYNYSTGFDFPVNDDNWLNENTRYFTKS